MTIDFAGLLDAPAYSLLGTDAVITPPGGVASNPIRVLDKTVEVEEAGASGVIIPTVRPAADLRLADLAAEGLTREDLKKAEVTFAGVLYRVLATQPGKNARDLCLILTEVE